VVDVGLCSVAAMVYDAGVGRHLAYNMRQDPTTIASWAKSLYALEWLYLPSVALPKISLLLLYLRIFTDRPSRITTHVLLWFLVVNWVVYLITVSLQCTPFAYQWDKSIPNGRCVNQAALYKTVSAPNIATDLVILLLPVKTVLQLKVSRARKLGLLFTFLTGSM
jgi:hypothetical protein